MNEDGPLLGQVLRLGDDPHLKGWGADVLDGKPIAAIGDVSGAVYDLVCASLGDQPRIHPSAYVSPLANVAADVVIGPEARIHEYSTVRGRTVISGGVHIGYGCEISRSVIGAGTVLSHRATISCSVIGQHAYFATGLVTASCLLSNPDMLHPTRTVEFGLPDGGRMSTGLAKWGALVGDRVRAGVHVVLSPGTVVGADSILHAGITVPTAWIPPGSTLHPPTGGFHLTPRTEGAAP
ncbi:hypothetical protein [Streptomyces sp. NBC_01445]|uniref:hypothetical protein n=1 Tax=Streptomyces sp. NBC_01445 TaxID=2903869 RepID=UPI002DD89F29|nr:hypothetical protein [Streptomyces sp. NBC_01445]WSE01992.1 hypothetical protein OG574_00235 [Streptomyces sp. NBC_01445]WSE10338.1 hypothetical protein OG574_47775 [Streptomyces sp. NBC_01445]WSE11094.1 hypothetical protein OG574_48245 [Streptomyces sp. NBC_01445]